MSEATMFGAFAPREVGTRAPMDRRSTSHAITCNYLVGRGFRVCSCSGARRSR